MNKTIKTRFLNLIRQNFANPAIEQLLIKLVNNKSPDYVFSKLLPNHYQYRKLSIRKVIRKDIRYQLDISDLVDWYVYFGLKESTHEKLLALCNKEDIIIDIGTNIGSLLMQFAQKASDGNVLGFEPDPYNYNKCLTNLQLNKFRNIELQNIGIGNQTGTFVMYVPNANNRGMNRITTEINNNSHQAIQIQVIALDEFLAKRPVKKISLIKIDVEGFEFNVLKGAYHSIAKHRPVLFIEVNDNNLKEQNSSAKELIAYVEDLHYQIRHADSGKPIASSDDFSGTHFDIICKP